MAGSITFRDADRNNHYDASEISDAFATARRHYLDGVRKKPIIGDTACTRLTNTLNALDDARDRLLAKAKASGGSLRESEIRSDLARTYTPKFSH